MAELIGLDTFYKYTNQQVPAATHDVGHFNIFTVDDLLLKDHKPISYSRRNFFKVSLVNGDSRIHYADQVIAVQGGVLVFTNPMIPYHWERLADSYSGFVCIFTEAFFSRFGNIKDYPVFQNHELSVIPLSIEDYALFNQLFSRMHQELEGNYAYKYDLLRSMLMEVIHTAQKMQPAIGSPQTGSNASERIAGIFTELLERQFPIEMNNQAIRLSTPSAFANQLNVHVNHLNKALKEVTGQTTSQLINARLLQEARILLKHTSWTINEIAWCLGFEEPNHFSSFFKNLTKTTPNQFRKMPVD